MAWTSYDNDTYHEYQSCTQEVLGICVPTLSVPFASQNLLHSVNVPPPAAMYKFGGCRPRILFVTLLFPALGLVFPDQPFWQGKSRFWSPRDHNSKGEGYSIAIWSC